MIYQVTKGLHPDLQEWGCYFLAILKVFEKITKVALTVEQINTIYKTCRKMGYVGPEALIISNAIKGMAQIASGVTKKHAYMKRTRQDGKYHFIIAMFQRKTSAGKVVTHFILVDDKDKILYDPWSAGGSRTARDGKLINRRYIYGVKI